MTFQVVVILKETDYGDDKTVEVHGVYVDLKEFHDEARTKGYEYDDLHNGFYTYDQFQNFVWFQEEVQDLKGFKVPIPPFEGYEDE